MWERDAWLELLQRFIHQDEPPAGKGGWEPSPSDRVKLAFPRYHQWQCVRTLLATSQVEGAGSSHLVQQLGGLKTKTIAWLAHGLTTLHGGDDQRVFHKVVVVTDRGGP